MAASSGSREDLILGLQLEPPNLDPTLGASGPTNEVGYANLYEGLLRIGRDGRPKPHLALWWEVSADGRDYVFHLRPKVRFHNGVAFDAAVAKFSLDRARAPGSANANKVNLEAITAVEVLDRLTLRLRLSRPYSPLLSVLALGPLVMVEPTSAATNAAHPVGTGPFRFASWRRGDSIDLVRNESYWGAPAPLRRVRFRFISDPNAAYAAIRSGDVDAFQDYPAPENLAALSRDPRLKVVVGRTEGETLLAINNSRPPFNDLRVRRAIAHAIDREAIIRGAMYGYGDPIGSHFPPGAEGYIDLTGRYPHDPARARALLAEAGYPGGIDVTLKLPPPSYARRTGEILISQLGQAGVRVRTENLEWAQWLTQVFQNHDFDLTVVSHVEPADYDIYGRDGYYFGYRSPALKADLAELERTSDETRRLVLLRAIQTRLADDAVNGFLFEFPKLGVWDSRLEGLWADAPVPLDDVTEARFRGGASADTGRGSSGAGVRIVAWAAGLSALLALVYVGFLAGPRYVASRALTLSLTLAVASFAIFLVMAVLPGDPALLMMGVNANPKAVAALNHSLGLDHPWWVRYLTWVGGALRGDFGTSFTYRVPVSSLIAERLSVSGPLALYALIVSVGLGAAAGLAAALRPGGLRDRALMGASQVGVAMPDFWVGILLVLAFSVSLRWFGAGGFPGWEAGLGPALKALTLPAIALALPQAAILARVLRAALIETLNEDYVRTARARGLSRGQALYRHALPNALIPVLTLIGLQTPFLLSGAVIVENVFFLPGLGRLVTQAIVQRDLIVVQAVVALLVASVVLIAFLVDLTYALVDPRLRQGARP